VESICTRNRRHLRSRLRLRRVAGGVRGKLALRRIRAVNTQRQLRLARAGLWLIRTGRWLILLQSRLARLRSA
jgi:hypothetical protein